MPHPPVPFMHSSCTSVLRNDQFSMITLAFKAEEKEGKYAMAFRCPSNPPGSRPAYILRQRHV